jgi:hypothetical protein
MVSYEEYRISDLLLRDAETLPPCAHDGPVVLNHERYDLMRNISFARVFGRHVPIRG